MEGTGRRHTLKLLNAHGCKVLILACLSESIHQSDIPLKRIQPGLFFCKNGFKYVKATVTFIAKIFSFRIYSQQFLSHGLANYS